MEVEGRADGQHLLTGLRHVASPDPGRVAHDVGARAAP